MRALLRNAFLVLACCATGCLSQRPQDTLLRLEAQDAAHVRRETLSRLAMPNRAAEPCVDFYEYACGNVDRGTSIPDGYGVWGDPVQMRERNIVTLWRILSSEATEDKPALMSARAYYRACLRERPPANESLRPLLQEIDAVHDEVSLATTAAHLQLVGAPVLFTVTVTPDDEARMVRLLLMPGGIGLRSRSLYLDADMAPIKDQYFQSLARGLRFLGNPEETIAGTPTYVMTFETRLARTAIEIGDSRQTWEEYRELTLADLKVLAPHFDWSAFFAAMDLPTGAPILAVSPQFLNGLSDALGDADMATLRAYLRLRLLSNTQALLNDEVYQALFARQEAPPRWYQCTEATANLFEPVMSEAYVRARPASEALDHAADVIESVRDGWKEVVASTSVLDTSTREKALAQIGSVPVRRWSMPVAPEAQAPDPSYTDYFRSTLELRRRRLARLFASLGQAAPPADVSPSSFGAVPGYLSNPNFIYLPPIALAPPLFDSEFPPEINFARLGSIVGRELTHAVDARTQYLRRVRPETRWWTRETIDAFDKRSHCLVDWFTKYSLPAPPTPWFFVGAQSLKVSGERTFVENVADLTGVQVSYRAYRKWRGIHSAPTFAVAGHTPEQTFFLAYAQGWCTAYREPGYALRDLADEHAPPRFRVNGALANLPEFAAAFGCPVESPMHAPQCEVW